MTRSGDVDAAVDDRVEAGCSCDFCAGRKRWADNWCPACAEVLMQPPKWWDNLDVCDACERRFAAEAAERRGERIFTDEQRAMLLALIPRVTGCA